MNKVYGIAALGVSFCAPSCKNDCEKVVERLDEINEVRGKLKLKRPSFNFDREEIYSFSPTGVRTLWVYDTSNPMYRGRYYDEEEWCRNQLELIAEH